MILRAPAASGRASETLGECLARGSGAFAVEKRWLSASASSCARDRGRYSSVTSSGFGRMIGPLDDQPIAELGYAYRSCPRTIAFSLPSLADARLAPGAERFVGYQASSREVVGVLAGCRDREPDRAFLPR